MRQELKIVKKQKFVVDLKRYTDYYNYQINLA
jgi:hypothetical protein